MKVPISDAAVRAVVEAVFKEHPLTVIEAYSAFEEELLTFQSVDELFEYVMARRDSMDGNAHFAVHYPDMAGTLARTHVSLDPHKCGGHTHRYKAEGWGLIWVCFQLRPAIQDSFISANSEKRAHAWVATNTTLAPPAAWDWSAVARHLRRLRRALSWQ